MKIKKTTYRDRIPQNPRSKFLVIFVGLLIFGSVCFAAGIFFHKTNAIGYVVKPWLESKGKAAWHYVRSRFVTPEKLTIHLKFKDYQKLAYRREQALKEGVLQTQEDDYVSASIEQGDKVVKARVRLKGDFIDQMRTERWPFRVVVKGDETIFGMKRFSLHIPETRGYLTEWLLHENMRREGVIALRYDFVDVALNGKLLGVYAIEEHFEKRLIENNDRREGPIISFSEDVDIGRIHHYGIEANRRGEFYQEKIHLYRQKRTFENPLLKKQFNLAKNMLESFRLGKLPACDVFDCPLLAKYTAILDLFTAHHAARYGNFKLYFNPVTAKLEPICFDAEAWHTLGQIYTIKILAENWHEQDLSIYPLIYEDQKFFEMYLTELERVVQDNYLDRLFEDVDDELKEKQLVINKSYPWYEFNKGFYYENRDYIRKFLQDPFDINAYFKGVEGGNIVIKVGNIKAVPIKIQGLALPGVQDMALVGEDVVLNPRLPKQPVITQELKFKVPDGFEWDDDFLKELRVIYSYLGVDNLKVTKVVPWTDLDENFTRENLFLRRPNVNEFSFLDIDEESKEITFKAGDWTIDKDLVIPSGYQVFARNITLDLTRSAMIASYSAIHFLGRESRPIVIQSSDGTGQGLFVLNTSRVSSLENVIFNNLSYPHKKTLDLTGAVTFYEAPVSLNDVQFVGNKAEDSLNIIRSNYVMADVAFSHALFDAFDSDFSNGEIIDTTFIDCGNDCIDISGSEIKAHNIFIKGAGDKGISIGEKSKLVAKDVAIEDVNIGIASKDSSEALFEQLEIRLSSVGLTSYRKKSEFTGASIRVDSFDHADILTLYKIEKGSALQINGKLVMGDIENLYEKLYESEK